MDWQTFFVSVITSLFTSSAIAAGLAYLLKRSFDKALDLKYEKILEKFRLSAKEETRRSSELYDLQAKAFREILTQVYRIRNSSRKLRDWVGLRYNEQEIDEQVVAIRDQDELFSELLYVYRAVLPNDFFQMAHEINHQTIKLFDEHYCVGDKFRNFNQLPEIFEQIDLRYRNLIGIVQNHLGIESDTSQYPQSSPLNSH